jgi:hypothetical protein
VWSRLLILSTRILSIDPHVLACQIAAPRNSLASTKPQIHSDLDILSTHIHDGTINDPAAINDSHARDRKRCPSLKPGGNNKES